MEIQMTETEHTRFQQIKENNDLGHESAKFIAELHSKYYNHQYYVPCSCSASTWKQWIAQLNDIWDNGYKVST